MNAVRKLTLGGLVCLFISTAGCVSRDEYLRTEFARRKAAERADALERDLADERNKVLALESERESMKRELDAKTALYETAKAENDRLTAFADKLQAQMDEVLKRGPGNIEVVQLPPELDKALKEFAANYPDMVEYDAKHGAVRWKSDLTFGKGSDEVKEAARQSLAAFADIVKSAAASAFEVVVVGHTDTLPIGPITAKKHPTNWHLSAHRAIAVMYNLKQAGVDYVRMGCMGYGEFRPRVPNPPRGGCEENRRVEIFLVSSKDHVPGMDTSMYQNPNDGGVYAKMTDMERPGKTKASRPAKPAPVETEEPINP
jgi:chemotaxis protein MotB